MGAFSKFNLAKYYYSPWKASISSKNYFKKKLRLTKLEIQNDKKKLWGGSCIHNQSNCGWKRRELYMFYIDISQKENSLKKARSSNVLVLWIESETVLASFETNLGKSNYFKDATGCHHNFSELSSEEQFGSHNRLCLESGNLLLMRM